MGAHLAKHASVFATPHLTERSGLVLLVMCVTALDTDARPWYAKGSKALAGALFPIPEQDATDAAAIRAQQAVDRKVTRALAELEQHGYIAEEPSRGRKKRWAITLPAWHPVSADG